MKTPPPTDPTPKHDPWLHFMDRWEIRIIRLTLICGLLIYAYKHLRHELEGALPASPAAQTLSPAQS